MSENELLCRRDLGSRAVRDYNRKNNILRNSKLEKLHNQLHHERSFWFSDCRRGHEIRRIREEIARLSEERNLYLKTL